MDCEVKDECANYDGECTNDDYCLCEDFEQITEKSKLYNALYKTIEKLREYNQEDLIKQVAILEKREDEFREKIAELKAQLPNVDKLRKECLQEVRKEVFGQFTVGQTVFIVGSENNRTTCTECKGTGKITCTISTGETKVDCPICRGYKKIDNYKSFPKKERVSSLVLIMWTNSDTRQPSTRIDIYLEGYDYNKTQTELFTTAEECQAYIDSKVKK